MERTGDEASKEVGLSRIMYHIDSQSSVSCTDSVVSRQQTPLQWEFRQHTEGVC